MQSITSAGMGRRQAPVHPLAELAEAKAPTEEAEEDASPDSAAWSEAAQHKLQDVPIWTVQQKRSLVLLQKDPVRPLMCTCTGLAQSCCDFLAEPVVLRLSKQSPSVELPLQHAAESGPGAGCRTATVRIMWVCSSWGSRTQQTFSRRSVSELNCCRELQASAW